MRGKALLTTEPENEILILRLQKTQLLHKMQIGRVQDVIHVCVCASKHAALVHVSVQCARVCRDGSGLHVNGTCTLASVYLSWLHEPGDAVIYVM